MNACGVDLQPPRLPTSMIRASERACARQPRLTSSSIRITSAAPSARAALSVISSGSPGPAPMRYTLPPLEFIHRLFATSVPPLALDLPRDFCTAPHRGSASARLMHRARVLHRGGEQPIDLRPRLAHLRRERFAQHLLQ